MLLMLLAAAAGSADAWSYFGLGHSFVANMTGNTVLIGVAAARLNGEVVHPLISVGCYAIGAVTGALLTRNIRSEGTWPKTVSWSLLLEAFILALAETRWAMVDGGGPQPTASHDGLLACVALAIGMQSGVMLQMKIPGVVTTYITGTWTNLMSEAARLLARRQEPQAEGAEKLEDRILLQGEILSVYLLSAFLAGLLLRYTPGAAGALPAAAVSLVATYGLVRN